MFKKIIIIWWGKTWTEIAKTLSKKWFNIDIITRDKKKLKEILNFSNNIKIKDYNDPVEKNLPCIITVSCDEIKIIKKLIAKWEKNISRLCVLKDNLKIIDNILPYLNKIKASHYFILSNPVELIMYYISKKIENNINVYWLWMDLDSNRFKYAIQMWFWYKIKDIYCIWNHSFQAVPVIKNNKLSFNNISLKNIQYNISAFKNYKYSANKKFDYLSEFKKEIEKTDGKVNNNLLIDKKNIHNTLNILVSILTRSEFKEWKPPIKSPWDSVAKVINDISQWKDINISYIKRWEIKWGKININYKWWYREKIEILSETEKKLTESSDSLLKKALKYVSTK